MSDKGEDHHQDNTTAADAPPDSLIRADDSRQYWSSVDADVNGMLGGFPQVSRIDLRGSRSFLAKLGLGRNKGVKAIKRAMEGGAG